MNSDLTTQLMTMNSVKLQTSVQMAVFKKANDMQNELLEMLLQPAKAALPAGQGTRIDKLA